MEEFSRRKSRRRRAAFCAHAFVDKVHAQGSRGRALEEDLTHAQINKTLGVPSDYTTEVDTFLRSVW